MNPTEFCYWLRGFLEMANPKDMNEQQMSMLKDHLDLVFVNVTHETSAKIEELKDEPKKELLTDSVETAPDKICGESKIQEYIRRAQKTQTPRFLTDEASWCSSTGIGFSARKYC